MSNDHHWGYSKSNGPETWGKHFPTANGKRQSPIDIEVKNVEKINTDKPLKYYFSKCCEMKLTNTGHGWQICCENWGEINGGPLENKYKLKQFHCHWGETSDEGSEHTVLGKQYAGELHFVHWNAEKYKTFGEAANQPDGLSVLALFLEVCDQNNKELDKICENVKNIEFQNQHVKLGKSINISKLIPKTDDYWTYLGSLTTPPCTESVIWIVYKTPIHVSEAQLSAFRYLKSHSKEEIVKTTNKDDRLMKNYRPTLPIGDRVIKEFRHGCHS